MWSGHSGRCTPDVFIVGCFNALPGMAEVGFNKVFYIQCHLRAEPYNTFSIPSPCLYHALSYVMWATLMNTVELHLGSLYFCSSDSSCVCLCRGRVVEISSLILRVSAGHPQCWSILNGSSKHCWSLLGVKPDFRASLRPGWISPTEHKDPCKHREYKGGGLLCACLTSAGEEAPQTPLLTWIKS